MKKIVTFLVIVCLLSQTSFAQNKMTGQRHLGVSFILNDFVTAQRIRNTSAEHVISSDSWATFKEMNAGLALHYIQDITSHVDFNGTLGFSFANYPFTNKPSNSSNKLLLEADASVNLKMFPNNYWVSPYISAGVGASKFQGYYGAIIPLGLGIKVNVSNEASIYLTSAYKVPVTPETTNYHFTYGIGISSNIGKKK